MQRTFIALKVYPQKEMSDCIIYLQEALKQEKLKWVDPANLHLTIRFLGDTNPQQLKLVRGILNDTVPRFHAPVISYGGLGLFRSIRDPRVLWIGMERGQVLRELKNTVDEKLITAGFPPEERKFHPHLTLARIRYVKNKDILAGLLTKYHESTFQKTEVNELVYYESILRPEGPEYIVLERVSFKT